MAAALAGPGLVLGGSSPCALPLPPSRPPSTFDLQMHMAITLASIGAALLAFAAGSKKSKGHMHAVRPATPWQHVSGGRARVPPGEAHSCIPAVHTRLSRPCTNPCVRVPCRPADQRQPGGNHCAGAAAAGGGHGRLLHARLCLEKLPDRHEAGGIHRRPAVRCAALRCADPSLSLCFPAPLPGVAGMRARRPAPPRGSGMVRHQPSHPHPVPATPTLASGPLLLAGMVVSALTAIFLVSCVDLWWVEGRGRWQRARGGWCVMWTCLRHVRHCGCNCHHALTCPSVLPSTQGRVRGVARRRRRPAGPERRRVGHPGADGRCQRHTADASQRAAHSAAGAAHAPVWRRRRQLMWRPRVCMFAPPSLAPPPASAF